MNAFRAAGFRIVGHLVFPKCYTSTTKHLRYQHECAYLLAQGYPKEPAYPLGDVIDFIYSGNKLHPTEKPISALLPLVETFSKPGNLVLDPLAGSGSTLHAAKSIGRNYLGIELDAKYHAVAGCASHWVYDRLVDQEMAWKIPTRQESVNSSVSPVQANFSVTTAKTITVTDEKQFTTSLSTSADLAIVTITVSVKQQINSSVSQSVTITVGNNKPVCFSVQSGSLQLLLQELSLSPPILYSFISDLVMIF